MTYDSPYLHISCHRLTMSGERHLGKYGEFQNDCHLIQG